MRSGRPQHDARSIVESVEEILRAGGRSLFSTSRRRSESAMQGRNILRSDGINNIDFGILKTRASEKISVAAPRRLLQFH